MSIIPIIVACPPFVKAPVYAASQYHLPDFGIVNVAPCSDGAKFALVLDFKLPSLKVIVPDPFDKGFSSHQLLVGLSSTTSVAARLFVVKSLLLPETSLPISELSAKSKRKPLFPKVRPLVFFGIQMPSLVSPKLEASKAVPSIKLTSAI